MVRHSKKAGWQERQAAGRIPVNGQEAEIDYTRLVSSTLHFDSAWDPIL